MEYVSDFYCFLFVMSKIKISTSVWSALHPYAGQNIQQSIQKYFTRYSTIAFILFLANINEPYAEMEVVPW